jgi:hypothetical protein
MIEHREPAIVADKIASSSVTQERTGNAATASAASGKRLARSWPFLLPLCHLTYRICFPTCPSHRNRSRSTAENHFTVLSIGGLAGALSRSHFDGLSLNSYDTGDGQRRRIADRQGHGRQVVTALCLTPGWLGFDLHVGCFFSKIYSPYGL